MSLNLHPEDEARRRIVLAQKLADWRAGGTDGRRKHPGQPETTFGFHEPRVYSVCIKSGKLRGWSNE